MPTFRHGKLTSFKIGDATGGAGGGTLTDISNVLRDVNMPRQIDTAETTAFQSTVKTYVIGIPGATFTVSGMFDLTADTLFNSIMGLEDARNFEYGPEGSSATRRKITGKAYLTNYSLTGSVADMVGFTGDFQITGAVTIGVFP